MQQGREPSSPEHAQKPRVTLGFFPQSLGLGVLIHCKQEPLQA